MNITIPDQFKDQITQVFDNSLQRGVLIKEEVSILKKPTAIDILNSFMSLNKHLYITTDGIGSYHSEIFVIIDKEKSKS